MGHADPLVAEIRILDADEFLQHNAFCAPGAPSLEELREAPLKVDHFKAIYARMHRGITAIPGALTADNLHLLDGIDFAFLSLDAGEAKAALVGRLHERGIGFIDIGMGLELGDHGLSGILRVTTSTPATRDTVGPHARIPLTGGGAKDVYASIAACRPTGTSPTTARRSHCTRRSAAGRFRAAPTT